MLKLLVFDLDGTLADTRADLAASVNHALAGSGLPALGLEAVMARIGDGARALIRGCLEDARHGAGLPADDPGDPGLEDRTLAAFLAHYRDHCLVHTSAYPGLAGALSALSRYRMAVLTNKPGEPARRVVAGLGLGGAFADVMGGDNPYGRKPDPMGLQRLMADAGVRPGETAMIGDGVQDALAARAADASFIAFTGGIGPREPLLAAAPDAVIASMADLPAAVASLEERLADGRGSLPSQDPRGAGA